MKNETHTKHYKVQFRVWKNGKPAQTDTWNAQTLPFEDVLQHLQMTILGPHVRFVAGMAQTVRGSSQPTKGIYIYNTHTHQHTHIYI